MNVELAPAERRGFSREINTGLSGKPVGQGGLPRYRNTDDRRLGSAIATLRIASVETASWCRRLACNDGAKGPNNVEERHVRPSAPIAVIIITVTATATGADAGL
jgi:hypothetical protein